MELRRISVGNWSFAQTPHNPLVPTGHSSYKGKAIIINEWQEIEYRVRGQEGVLKRGVVEADCFVPLVHIL